MVQIIASNGAIEAELARMVELVREGGGFIHEGLIFREEGGDLSVEAGPDIDSGAKIFNLPNAVLLLRENFELSVRDDEILVGEAKPEVSALQRKLMESHMTLYNLTGKLATFRKISTQSLRFSHPDIFALITKSVGLAPLGDEATDHFYLEKFLQTRVIGLKALAEEASGEQESNEGKQSGTKAKQKISALMPLVDFINHAPQAAGFHYDTKELSVAFQAGKDGGRQCFVRYGRHDALNCLLVYSYVDRSLPFFFSIPISADLGPLGRLNVARSGEMAKKKSVPAPFKDIAAFVPNFNINRNENCLTLSQAAVPPPMAPRALRRVLSAGIRANNPSADLAAVMKAVNLAEEQIIEGNRAHFAQLKTLAESALAAEPDSIPLRNTRDAAHYLLSIVESYSYERARA